MWKTSTGTRTLSGAEAALVRMSVESMLLGLELGINHEEPDEFFAIPLFDDLPVNSQIAMLYRVTKALLEEDCPAPELTALNEATVAAIFENARHWIDFEMECYEDAVSNCYWRRSVLAALRQADSASPGITDSDEPVITEQTTDATAWDIVIECVSQCVLWDADWRDEQNYLDRDPEKAKYVKEIMMIDPDYYTAIAPDPSEEETVEIFEKLSSLVKEQPSEA